MAKRMVNKVVLKVSCGYCKDAVQDLFTATENEYVLCSNGKTEALLKS